MKKILFPTDYSKKSGNALKYAYKMCLKLNAKLIVVHIFDYPSILDDLSFKAQDPFPDIEEAAYQKHNAKLNAFCVDTLKSSLQHLNIEIEAIENKSVVQGIVSKANEIKPLLIIMGLEWGSAIQELIIGNITKQLYRTSPCPILAVPGDVSWTLIKTLVYATDFEEEDLGAIKTLAEIVSPFNATLRVLHIFSLKAFNKNESLCSFKTRVEKFVNYDNIEFDSLSGDDFFEQLKLYLGENNADIIAMLAREPKSIASTIFHRDLVKKMAAYGRMPLISFNAKNYGIFHL